MNAALDDLRTRILANTLTAGQQTLLANALAVISPTFPRVDEIATAVPGINMPEIQDAWVAPLFAIAIAGGSSQLDPRSVTQWYVSTATGSDSNSGTAPQSPLKTFAALGAIWRGAQPGGGRATLTPISGTSVTVFLLDAHDPTDPLAPILDVDLNASAALIIQGHTLDPVHSGTFTSVSAFARTSAGGNVAVTDATVANFGALFGLMIQDETTNAVGWVVGPDGSASATGQASIAYSPQTAGELASLTQTNLATGNTYIVNPLFTCSLGSGFTTRSFPATDGLGSQVFFYRLAVEQPNFGDAAILASPGVSYVFQECSIETDAIQALDGAQVLFLNTLSVHASISAGAGALVEGLFGGGVVGGSLIAQAAGTVFADADFLVSGSGGFQCFNGGTLSLGAVAHFGTGPALVAQGGLVDQAANISGLAILYGTCGATAIEAIANGGGPATILYANDSSGTPAANAFKLSNGVIALGKPANVNGFGFNATTGLFVGPTATTIAHLDAALGAGTGFGGAAIDPATGCTMRLAS